MVPDYVEPANPQAGPQARAPTASPNLSRRIALCGAWTSTVTWTVAICVLILWRQTRPPCPPGYVRLIDLAGVLPLIAGAGILVGVVSLGLARSPRSHRTLAVLVWLSAALALFIAFEAVALIIAHRGARYDGTCWTF